MSAEDLRLFEEPDPSLGDLLARRRLELERDRVTTCPVCGGEMVLGADVGDDERGIGQCTDCGTTLE